MHLLSAIFFAKIKIIEYCCVNKYNNKHMMTKKRILVFFVLLTISVIPTIVFAEGELGTTKASCNPGEFCNPLGTTDIPTLAGRIINAVLGIVGSIALVMFIYGGFSWMTAAGNQEAVTKGKNILIWATVGLIVIFSAYALVNFVFTAIGGG